MRGSGHKYATFEIKACQLRVMAMSNCFIIAEAGVNHNGSEELAIELVDAAAKAGADAVKFQTFKADALVTRDASTAEYQREQTGEADQYSMLKRLEISEQLHHKLIDHCRKLNIEFMSTPFDFSAAEFLVGLGMKRLKVPSGELTNLPFIAELAGLDRPMILSTGMATLDEVKDAVGEVRKVRTHKGFLSPLSEMLSVLHCTSNYPARLEDVNLKAMETLVSELELPVGYSDHTDGDLISVAAVAMGACIVEKHFTMDRSLPGPDHQASLEPEELKGMVEKIRQVQKSLGDGEKSPRPSELPVRELVRRSVTLKVDKAAGEPIQAGDLVLLRPATGIEPKYMNELVGRCLNTSLKSGSVLKWQDIKE